MVSATTQGITVKVICSYQVNDSVPHLNQYVFSYRVRIENANEQNMQLVSRHWRITNGIGEEREVTGEGVVGQQPQINTGYAFEYSSFCVLATPLGYMEGTYLIQFEAGQELEVQIPRFKLEALTLQN